MTVGLTDLAAKVIGDKRRWRAYKARTRQLPDGYRTAVDAIERYLMHLGPAPADADTAAAMFEDLVYLFEQAAADGTPIRAVVGEDPADFVEAFAQSYRKGGWVARERRRLLAGIERSEAAGSGAGS